MDNLEVAVADACHMSFARILWPQDEEAAVRLHLGFVIAVVDEYAIVFPREACNPVPLAQGLLAGSVMANERSEALSAWWDYIDDNGYIRDFRTPEAISARFAICLLSPSPDSFADCQHRSDSVEWVIQLVEYAGKDSTAAYALMREHFTFGDFAQGVQEQQ